MTTDNTVETGLEAAAIPAAVAETPAPEQTTTAVGGAEVQMTEVPKAVYDEAVEDNRQQTFVTSILEARAPKIITPYQPPPIPVGVAAQTAREMEAGRARVAEFAANEEIRKKVAEAHRSDKWGSEQKSTPVFRPADFVPDQKKGQGRLVGGQTSEV